jgi:tetratricopeptide (TPR) repeat protein
MPSFATNSSIGSDLDASWESFQDIYNDFYLFLNENSAVLQSLAILAGLFLCIIRYGSRIINWFTQKNIHENKSDYNHNNHSDSESKIPDRIFRVPYHANPNFTGRRKFLDELHQSLVQAASSPTIFALVGIGGMGKTQIALEHAHRPENGFKYVWWLRSEEPSTLLDDYIGIAEDLNLPGWNMRDTDQTIKAVKRELEAECSSNWLLVFDNAQKPDDLMRYLPAAGSGQIIITSRLSVWDGMAKALVVGVFQRDEKQDESVEFLLKRTGGNDRDGAKNLARELGDLPLALEQAGAYIKETGISFSDYLDRFKKDRKKLLNHGKPLNYPDTVATTWEISFQAVQKERPVAGDLLNLCAFLAPDAIPRAMLEDGARHLTAALASCVQDTSEFDECIAVLKKYSLINVADSLISIHRLVQAVVQDRLSLEEQKLWVESALKMVNDAFSFHQFDQETWERSSKLSAHAFYTSGHAERLSVSLQETAILLNHLGNYLHNRMELTLAKSVLERAIAIDEKALGADHTRVAIDLNDLGLVLRDLIDLEGAESCLKRALEIDEKAFGPEHISVALRVNNLGSVMLDQDDLVGAKRCFERALAIDEKAFGLEHVRTAVDINNLGMVLQAQGDLVGAKGYFERALAIDEKALGPENTRTAIDITNLGSVMYKQNTLVGAKRCFERALSIDEKALGQEHTSVAIDLSNLGSVLRAQRELEGAKRCFDRALAIDEKAFGQEHTSVAIDLSNLGSVLQAQGELEGAKRCFERALKIFEKRLGKDHPNTVLVRNNLKSLQENS